MKRTYRIGVYWADERIALYDVLASDQWEAEWAALNRVVNALSVGVSSSEEEPDDTFNARRLVRSLDPRDDGEKSFVVIEDGISHVSGKCVKIAPPETPERTFYRLASNLVPVDADKF